MVGEEEVHAIGIDLGTTYSCVGVWQGNHIEIIANDEGKRTTPSYVAFTDTQRLIGDAAINKVIRNPAANSIFGIYDVKRLIGRRFSDKHVQKNMKLWPFKVIEAPGDRPMIVVTHKGVEKQFDGGEISSMLLRKMREFAEAYLERTVKKAVITVPTYFGVAQRQSTMYASVDAGLEVVHLLDEPTATAIAYGLDKKAGWYSKRNVMIFDLGGATLDISILVIGDDIFQVKATTGDSYLGGEDFDKRMVLYCVEEFKRMHELDVRENPRALMRLKKACEKAKRKLSFKLSTDIEIDNLDQGIDFYITITRSKFEQLNMDFFNECMKHVNKCLRDADMDTNSVHDVVLAGGSSRIPKVQQLLRNVFEGKKLCKSINPDEVVAYGAAMQAAASRGKLQLFTIFLDATPLSLGVGVNTTSLNTDKEHIMEIVIPRNTKIPVAKTITLTTDCDDPHCATFSIWEGESRTTLDNNFLGKLSLHRITPAPKRIPKFNVCFDIDENGILSVSVEEKFSGQKKMITITSSESVRAWRQRVNEKRKAKREI